MREPHYLTLRWQPSGLGDVEMPTGTIMGRLVTCKDNDVIVGHDCACKREIDESIDWMICDLEDARKAAHGRFDH